MSHKILSVCYQECLPVSTIELLESAGYLMICTRQLGAAIQLLQSQQFDLILINQTVSHSQEDLFVHLARENAQIPIIFVSSEVQVIPEGVSVWLKPPVSAKELLRRVEELLPPSKDQLET
ncbi:MAG TPA: response regulator [Terriglobales bacterium]|nr:response regulator [Terriglobales bacterium]